MTTKTEILKIIRANCIECSGGSRHEADLCTSTKCNLWPLRFGKDPNPARTGPKKPTFGRNVPTGLDETEGKI